MKMSAKWIVSSILCRRQRTALMSLYKLSDQVWLGRMIARLVSGAHTGSQQPRWSNHHLLPTEKYNSEGYKLDGGLQVGVPALMMLYKLGDQD